MSYDAYEYTVSCLAKSPCLHAYHPWLHRATCSVCWPGHMQVHSHTYDTAEIPAAKFTYDLSPIQILVSEKKRAWCASNLAHVTRVPTGPSFAISAACLPGSPCMPWCRYHFVTTTCAIIGGVFTVAGIVDGLIHTGTRFAKKVSCSSLCASPAMHAAMMIRSAVLPVCLTLCDAGPCRWSLASTHDCSVISMLLVTAVLLIMYNCALTDTTLTCSHTGSSHMLYCLIPTNTAAFPLFSAVLQVVAAGRRFLLKYCKYLAAIVIILLGYCRIHAAKGQIAQPASASASASSNMSGLQQHAHPRPKLLPGLQLGAWLGPAAAERPGAQSGVCSRACTNTNSGAAGAQDGFAHVIAVAPASEANGRAMLPPLLPV